ASRNAPQRGSLDDHRVRRSPFEAVARNDVLVGEDEARAGVVRDHHPGRGPGDLPRDRHLDAHALEKGLLHHARLIALRARRQRREHCERGERGEQTAQHSSAPSPAAGPLAPQVIAVEQYRPAGCFRKDQTGGRLSHHRIGYPVAGPVPCPFVYRRAWTTLTIIAGFLLGLFLARIDHIVSPLQGTGPVRTIAIIVDWTAPPLAGALVAAAFFVAQRYKRLHEAERAASRVLAERLAGTERRQAIWVVAAAIAHDLKNPLHNVQLLLEEASEEEDPGRRSELLARLRDNTDRAASRLSDLARAGRAPEEVERFVDLSVILDDLLARLASA